jgi:hypothetical protein
LSQIGCRPVLEGGKLHVRGAVDALPADLLAALRQAKPALIIELLHKQAWDLAAFINGDALLTERQARLPELLAVEEKLSAAQEALWASWRRAGFTILWNPLVEEFILVGDSSPPPGSEGMAVYTRAEVEALKDAAAERVIAAHKLKKVFSGAVKPCERAR